MTSKVAILKTNQNVLSYSGSECKKKLAPNTDGF